LPTTHAPPAAHDNATVVVGVAVVDGAAVVVGVAVVDGAVSLIVFL